MNEKMENKKIVEKKYDRFAVASFVLGLIIPLYLFVYLTPLGLFFPSNFFLTVLFISLSSILSIVFAILSISNKDNNLKGRLLAISGAVITLLIWVVLIVMIWSFPG